LRVLVGTLQAVEANSRAQNLATVNGRALAKAEVREQMAALGVSPRISMRASPVDGFRTEHARRSHCSRCLPAATRSPSSASYSSCC
jgi:hypothetical protein